MKENKVVFLQQRAPVMKGYASEFVSNLMAWVKQSAFKEIVLLFSADATRRNDKQLMQGYTNKHTYALTRYIDHLFNLCCTDCHEICEL
jgi:predicted ATP-grasp superfamily ATP-dependent carboligase